MKHLTRVLKTSLAAGIVLAAVSCNDRDVRYLIDRDAAQKPQYIEFSNFVNTLTRASKGNNTGSFVVGDTMAVWGVQTTGTDVDLIFNNQDIRYVDGITWTYDNKRIWNSGSTYMFYGVFPYSKSLYSMSTDGNYYVSIPTYTTPNVPASQKDLMISERRAISPFNTVDMIFHHILSNVNIYARISNSLNMDPIESITLKSIKLNNVMSTGSYAQTGWSQNRATGAWSGVNGYMDIPEVKDIVLSKNDTAAYADYLMIPQQLFSLESSPKDVTIDAAFRIVYKNGTSATHTKNGIRLAGITGRTGSITQAITAWNPNYKYNYTLVFNPEKTTRIWDADGDGSIQIDPETGAVTTDDDTPFPGTMKYNPDEPDKILIYEDTDGDGKPDTWNTYPIAWEDIDGDDKLEAGVDRDGDGHIDNMDNDNNTQQVPGGDPDKDPSDGNPNNPDGKDVILVHVDTDGDGDIDGDDEWVQIQKDITTGIIEPAREESNATIEFTATVQEWEQAFSAEYDVRY